MILAWLAFFDGLIAIALALAGMVGAHYGLATPFLGFQMFVFGFFISVLGLLIGIIGLAMTSLMPSRRAGRPRAIVGVILSLIVLIPIATIIATHKRYPPINDITTDTKNPPEFTHAQEMPGNQGRDMKYDATKYAPAQEGAAAYKDLTPLKLEGKPDDVFKKVEIIAGEIPDWQITYNNSDKRIIEGIATSAMFRFKDDFVIEVREAGGGASLVEMRSKSRDGKGDLGVNFRRIQSFFVLMQGPPRGASSAP
jgi:uncharacterized protein (DUF1499 family)